MAKKSKIAREAHRREVVARYADRRRSLKERVRTGATLEERMAAQAELQRLPRDASPTRLRNRDGLDGRPRGYLRRFGLSRVNLRRLAHEGAIPGLGKASW